MSNLYYSSVHSKQMFKWVWQDYVELSTSAKLIWRRFCSSCCFTSSAQKASFLGGVIGLTNWWRPSATIKSCFWVSAKHSLFDSIEHVALTLNKGIKLIIVFSPFFYMRWFCSNQIKSNHKCKSTMKENHGKSHAMSTHHHSCHVKWSHCNFKLDWITCNVPARSDLSSAGPWWDGKIDCWCWQLVLSSLDFLSKHSFS